MPIDRRSLLKTALFAGLASGSHESAWSETSSQAPEKRMIPSTGEGIPVVGLGSWITFNVGEDPTLLEECAEVIAAFVSGGGRLIDSSPMYGSSQNTIGYGLNKLGKPSSAFSADKVWTSSVADGRTQIDESRKAWQVQQFDLLQVHNLLAWRGHLRTLSMMKEQGQLRYLGITTSHGRRHTELERIMKEERIDFVQVSYNMDNRLVEDRILPMAADRGIGVIVNRPFQRGELIRKYSGKQLPAWLAETGARNWAQFLLKFVISHPAITCAIPATTRPEHVRENLEAAIGPLPGRKLRHKMIAYVENL